MEDLVRQWLVKIGENPEREGLKNTPQRVSEAWEYMTRGYTQDINEVINSAIFSVEANHMVIVKDIEIYSLCEHHMLPFFGRCHVGYIPKGKVFGVSKLARLADLFARRLQIQERLTDQIARVIMDKLNPEGVGVIIEARHLCMMMRGVEKQNSSMVTSAMLGSFHESIATRNEFLELISHEPRI
ncbi:MAG TPA: GTP cyclohydrolase I FolE [Verrucomicrobia bacterium]|nr:MAG: GTP cyclohydrolase I FolE [Lentisphaerae bacterium GWF2_57_35]HBA85840.1 GTP cyclohydrolase I FolE [Verrucomicrobiota bacterium]